MIDAQNARMNRLVQPMIDGNSDMAGLVAALTPPVPTPSCGALTNSNGIGPAWPWPQIGNVGTPIVGSSFSDAAPAVAAPTAVAVAATPAGSTGSGAPANSSGVAAGPGGSVIPLPPWMQRGYRYPGSRGGQGSPAGRSGGRGFIGARRGGRGPVFGRGGNERNGDSGYFIQPRTQSQIGNSVTNFTCPPGTKVIPVPAPAPAPITAQHPTPQPGATWACPSQSQCQTDNVCLDLKRGCVVSSQVSLEQMAACSQAGYAGNEGFFPCLIAQGPNLPFLGTPMPNPPQYSTVASQDVPPPASQNWVGLSGLGCGGGGGDLQNMVVIALGVTAGLFFAGWIAKEMVTA